MSEEAQPGPPESAAEITISSDYDKESDELRVLANLKVHSALDRLSRMNLMEMLMRAIVEKIATDFFENWSEEVYEQIDPEEIVKRVKEMVAERMTAQMGNTMAQVLAKAKEKDEVRARGGVRPDEVSGRGDQEDRADLEQP